MVRHQCVLGVKKKRPAGPTHWLAGQGKKLLMPCSIGDRGFRHHHRLHCCERRSRCCGRCCSCYWTCCYARYYRCCRTRTRKRMMNARARWAARFATIAGCCTRCCHNALRNLRHSTGTAATKNQPRCSECVMPANRCSSSAEWTRRAIPNWPENLQIAASRRLSFRPWPCRSSLWMPSRPPVSTRPWIVPPAGWPGSSSVAAARTAHG